MASTSNEESKIMEHHYGATMVQEMSVDYNVRHPRTGKMVIVTYQLVEKKKKTVDNPQVSDNTSKTTIHLHSRSIDAILETVKQAPGAFLSSFCAQLQLEGFFLEYEPCRSYSVKETLTEGQDGLNRIVVEPQIGQFDRPMTQEEVEKFEEKFEEDWSNLWNPQAKLELD